MNQPRWECTQCGKRFSNEREIAASDLRVGSAQYHRNADGTECGPVFVLSNWRDAVSWLQIGSSAN